MDKAPNRKVMSINFSHALFLLMDLLSLEDGTNKLSHNIDKELPLYAV
jgi:hypothetical protein